MRRQATGTAGNDAAKIDDAPHPGGPGGIRKDSRRVAVPLFERRACAKGVDEVVGHIDTLESTPHRGPVHRVGYRDLDVTGPGPAV